MLVGVCWFIKVCGVIMVLMILIFVVLKLFVKLVVAFIVYCLLFGFG